VYLVFVTALSQRVEAKVPGFEDRRKLRRVGLVGRQVLESNRVDLVVKCLKAIAAFEVEGIIALGPEDLRNYGGEAHDYQVTEGNRVNGYRQPAAKSASLFFSRQRLSSSTTALSKAAWL